MAEKTMSLIPDDLSEMFGACVAERALASPFFCRDEKSWAQHVRIPPGLGESILKRDLPADFEYRIMLSGTEGWLFLDGGDCSDSRKFDLATGIVQPGDLVIHGDTQYQGLGRRIMRNQIEFFHAIGMKTLRIHASREAGGYSWPRMGFLPDMPLNPESANDMKRRYDLIKPFLAAGDCPAALPLPPNEARDLWVIADQSVDIAARLPEFFKAAAGSFSGGDKEVSNTMQVLFGERVRQGRTVTLGQFLLAGTSYPAYLDLADAAQMKRAGAYAGGWRYIGYAAEPAHRASPTALRI